MSETGQPAPASAPPADKPYRWRRRLLWILLLVTCMTAGVSLLTQWGLRVLVNELQRRVPGLAISHVEGTLAGHLAIEDIRYVGAHEDIRLDRLSVTADPLCLLRRRICVSDITIGTLDWNTTTPRPASGFDFPAVKLPSLLLPFNLTLANVRMQEMIIRSNDFRMSILDARIRAHTDRQHVILEEVTSRLRFSNFAIDAHLSGDIDLRGQHTVSLRPRVVLDFAGIEDLHIEGELRGPALQPGLQATVRGLVDASVDLQASFLEKGWPVKGRIEEHEPTRLTEDGITLANTVADISGHVTRYHLKGSTRISGVPQMPDIVAEIDTTGGFNGLEAASVTGRLDASQKARYEGRFDWYPALAWDGVLTVDNVDAGQWVDSLKTTVSGTTRTHGRWWTDTPLELTVAGLRAEGEWQGQPVTARLDGHSKGWDVDIETLSVNIGKNRIDASGAVATQWNARAQLELPELGAVLPGLDGTVTGQITLGGDRHDPQVNLKATSPLLTVAGQRLQALAADVTGHLASHRVTLRGSMLGYDLGLDTDGEWHERRWQARKGVLKVKRGNRELASNAPIELGYDAGSGRLHLKDTCLEGGNGVARERWCAATSLGLTPLTGDVSLRLDNADPTLLEPFIRHHYTGVAGRWSGKSGITLKAGKPVAAEWAVTGRDIRLKRVTGKPLRPALVSKELVSSGQWQKGRLKGSLSSRWNDEGRIEASIDIPSLGQPTTLAMDIEAQRLPTGWITPWTGGLHSTRGIVSANVSGRIERGWPGLQGEVKIEAAALGVGSDEAEQIRELEARLDAAPDMLTLEGSFTDPQGTRWGLTDPVRIRVDAPGRSLQWLSGCLGNDAGTLCGTGGWSERNGLSADARAQGSLNPWITPFVQEGVVVDGPFEGEIHVRELKGRLQGDALFRSMLTARSGPASSDQDASANVLVNARLEDSTLSLESAMSTGERGILATRARLGLAPPHSLEGRLDVRGLDLSLFAPLFPELGRLQGRLEGHLDATGTTSTPSLAGQFSVREGKASSTRFPLTLQHFTADALLSDSSAVLTAQFENGRGKGELRSTADWRSGELISETRMTTRQYPLRRGSEIKIRVDSDLTLRSKPDDIRLEGLVRVNEGFIRVASLPETATQVSSDIVYLDGTQSDQDLGMPRVRANVTLQLTDLLQIDALGAQVRMNGAVAISHDPPLDPQGKGSFTVAEGYYKGYGQKLTIKKGQVIFNGPLDNPMLAITAVRQVDNVEAGLNITGPAQQPETTLFASKGGLSEQDILTYIITGRPPSEGTGDNRAAVNQALLAIGLYGGENVARDLASKVGIEDLEISTSSTQKSPSAEIENSFNVGGYVSPRLFVQYGVGINTPVNTLTLRYRLSRNVFLEALSGAESALDILYSFEVERRDGGE